MALLVMFCLFSVKLEEYEVAIRDTKLFPRKVLLNTITVKLN